MTTDPRFDTRIDTRFEHGCLKGRGCIENLGPGGVFVRTRTIPERGERLWIHFQGPCGEAITAMGIVWWTTLDGGPSPSMPNGFGMRLLASNGHYRRFVSGLARTGSHPVVSRAR
jgi:hypothetical protein